MRVSYAPAEAKLDFDAGQGAARIAPAERQSRADRHASAATSTPAWPRRRRSVDAVYTTPIEHHNPMEPHATVADWDGDRLTCTTRPRTSAACSTTLAKIFGIAPENVT